MRNLTTAILLFVCCYVISCSLTSADQSQPLVIGMIADALK
jgi:hypothetical protein